MKNNRSGQSSIIEDRDYLSIRRNFRLEKYRIIWDLAWYTGERWGALIQLKVGDVYVSKGKPREEITFRAVTRKAKPGGKRHTRQVPMHTALRDSLKSYKLDNDDLNAWMFPGKDGDRHISLRTADMVLRSALRRAGLEHKGISSHSTRRTFITKLHEKSVDIYTIQRITGHQDLKALGRYVEIKQQRIKEAIAQL